MKAKRYAINILTVEQASLASHFGRKGGDKFATTPYSFSTHRLPLLKGALATIECEIADTAVGGSHTIFIGRVVHASAGNGDPLAYYRGRMDGLARTLESETEVDE
ncbi:hypothetical protein GCM10027416_10070 [Okibacterium endophyticum]